MSRKPLLSIIASAILLTTMTVASAENATKPTDEQITENVKSKILERDHDLAARIQVSTQDGVVTLSGNVLTPQYALNALHDAGLVDGVVKVQNHLRLD
jgi:osmotically-inducible protein OsmY